MSNNSIARERRKFFRHPITVPIVIEQSRLKNQDGSESINISQGGLCFFWTRQLSKGISLQITIPVKNKQFKIKAKVAYSEKDGGTGLFQTGVSFLDYVSAFQAKLAEEALEILAYRKRLSQDLGREVSEEDAARQWIKNFAEYFPKF